MSDDKSTVEEKYPEHARMDKIKDTSQAIGEFMEWLGSEEIVLAKYIEVEGYGNLLLHPVRTRIEDFLCRYFDIDADKISEEKDQMLDEIRESFSKGNKNEVRSKKPVQ